MLRTLSGASVAVLLIAGESSAQEVRAYDGLQAGDEAYAAGEAERRQRIDDQLYLNDAMRARYGWLPSGSVVWYGNAAAGYGPPVTVEHAYAYASNRLFGRGRGLYIERYWRPAVSVFEPWPYIPGDIYGYSFPPYVRQSIGQRHIQTGPNRWESHPVYPDEAAPLEAVSEPEIAPEIEAPPPAPPIDAEDSKPEKAKKKRRYYF